MICTTKIKQSLNISYNVKPARTIYQKKKCQTRENQKNNSKENLSSRTKPKKKCTLFSYYFFIFKLIYKVYDSPGIGCVPEPKFIIYESPIIQLLIVVYYMSSGALPLTYQKQKTLLYSTAKYVKINYLCISARRRSFVLTSLTSVIVEGGVKQSHWITIAF